MSPGNRNVCSLSTFGVSHDYCRSITIAVYKRPYSLNQYRLLNRSAPSFPRPQTCSRPNIFFFNCWPNFIFNVSSKPFLFIPPIFNFHSCVKEKGKQSYLLIIQNIFDYFFFKDYCPLMCQLQRGGGNKNYELLCRIKYKESFVIDIGN